MRLCHAIARKEGLGVDGDPREGMSAGGHRSRQPQCIPRGDQRKGAFRHVRADGRRRLVAILGGVTLWG